MMFHLIAKRFKLHPGMTFQVWFCSPCREIIFSLKLDKQNMFCLSCRKPMISALDPALEGMINPEPDHKKNLQVIQGGKNVNLH